MGEEEWREFVQKKDRVNENYELIFKLKNKNRKKLRDKTVIKFLQEKAGYWKEGIKHVTKYKYYVEKLSDGRKIYLLRPTFLNKGIDFQVWIENFDKKGNDKRPSHKDIVEDLKIKKRENRTKLPLLLEAIERVWNCEDPDKVIKKYLFNYKKGLSVELLLKTLVAFYRTRYNLLEL